MVVKRPKLPGDEPAASKAGDVELMEHLVKKSLEINPELRGGKRTREVMKELRQEALAQAKTPPARAAAAPHQGDLSARRKSAISFFFEQKAEEHRAAAADLSAREETLRKERATLNRKVADELADFLGMMTGAVEGPEAREVLREFKSFLTQLGLTDAELLERAKKG